MSDTHRALKEEHEHDDHDTETSMVFENDTTPLNDDEVRTLPLNQSRLMKVILESERCTL